MILIFDLDDTLYDERSYVESGLHAVASFGKTQFGWNQQTSFHFLVETLDRQGRGAIFDEWLKAHGCHSQALLQACIRAYRHHTPRLRLNEYAQMLLPKLKNYPLYVVTDGHKIVQQRKVDALKVRPFFRKIFITHRYGLHHAKPSIYCFDLIRKRECCQWADMIYIADNPAKDFVNLNKIGAQTVRVLTGRHRNDPAKKGYEAKHRIRNLNSLLNVFQI
jgi:putative hydrolase of the HAD superfamily